MVERGEDIDLDILRERDAVVQKLEVMQRFPKIQYIFFFWVKNLRRLLLN